VQAKWGTSGDFSIRHDGSNTYLQDAGSGDLIIKSNGTNVKIIGDNDEDIARFTWNGSTQLYYNGSKKIETTSTGVAVTGNIATAGITSVTLGTSNFVAGVNAGNSIVSGGNYNTVVGDEAGTAITTGDDNTAVGKSALQANTGGAAQTAVGSGALATSTGSENTAVGYLALNHSTNATSNTAVGYRSLDTNTSASNNTSVGHLAMFANTTGANNTALGQIALRNNTTGANNTAVGWKTGFAITTGTNNTYVGREAGYNTTTGSYNAIIGQACRPDGVNSNYAMGIGYNLDCGGSYTTLGINTTDTRLNHGTTNWVTVSDERYKKDITDAVAGLSFINALQPRTFNYKAKGELPTTFRAYEEGSTEVFKDTTTQHGFIAQEVKAAMDADSSIKDGFKMWSERTDGSQEVGDAALIPILVKAIQELSARIKVLEGE